MRLYPNQIKSLEYVLNLVTDSGAVLDIELKKEIDKNKKWGSKDRRNFYQAAYDIIRNYELLSYMSNIGQKGIIGAYLDTIYDIAIDYERIDSEYPELPFHVRYSIPETLFNLYQRENIHAEDNLRAMHRAGVIYLRVNTSLISIDKFENLLRDAQIEFDTITEIFLDKIKISLQCIKLYQRTQNQREFFEMYQPYFEIQDIGSQILTELIDFSDAKVIIESCAGNGGKTTHILNKTVNQSPLHICFDKERKKLEHLIERIGKWKEHKVVIELAKEKGIAKYEGMADILYMDMPCTGSGTLKRQADLKYRINNEAIEQKTTSQREIFHAFDSTLKQGGLLAYSTCSLFHAENEKQIEYIIQQGYTLESSHSIEPRNLNSDGFFIALLRKEK